MYRHVPLSMSDGPDAPKPKRKKMSRLNKRRIFIFLAFAVSTIFGGFGGFCFTGFIFLIWCTSRGFKMRRYRQANRTIRVTTDPAPLDPIHPYDGL